MTVQYVVSIADTLLYFDAQRQPVEYPAEPEAGESAKLQLRLLPPEQYAAEDAQWDGVLAGYTAEQRHAAEISEAL